MLNQSGIFGPMRSTWTASWIPTIWNASAASPFWRRSPACVIHGVKINIVDTPGTPISAAKSSAPSRSSMRHAPRRCQRRPAAQTRYVPARRSKPSFTPIVVINKIDRPDARVAEVLNEIYDLFIDLDAHEDQLDFPVLYAVAKNGVAKATMEDESNDLRPLSTPSSRPFRPRRRSRRHSPDAHRQSGLQRLPRSPRHRPRRQRHPPLRRHGEHRQTRWLHAHHQNHQDVFLRRPEAHR